MPELAFVLDPRQNSFFAELTGALRFELDRIGISASVSAGFPEPRDGLVYIVVPPHEYAVLGDLEALAAAAARSIFVCAEQPGTPHFEQNAALAASAGAVFDISGVGVAALERQGIPARHLQLGYSEFWDREEEEADRDLDLVFLGCTSRRRLELLGRYARLLEPLRCRLLLSDNSVPNAAASPSFVTGENKWRLLARAKVLLNLHQGAARYLGWLRAAEAISNGCVVVSEASADSSPLEAGRHFVTGRAESLPYLVEALVEDDAWRRRLACDAKAFLRKELPLADAALELATIAEAIAGNPVALRRRGAPPAGPSSPIAGAPAPRQADDDLRTAVKELALELQDLRRKLDVTRRGAAPLLRVVTASQAYSGAAPRVSILVTVYNYDAVVRGALDSSAAGTFRSIELVVVDDGSEDDSLADVARWVDDHPAVPAIVIRHEVNRGLPRARNTALDFARGELVFILDADNRLFPRGLERLVAALDADDGATFAYGLLERSEAGRPIGIANVPGWEPQQLAFANYVDAMALIRTRELRLAGGYTTDRRLHGWEDYDLWCRFASRGLRGVRVPEFVGSYRIAPHTMLALTNLSGTVARSVLAERYPAIFAQAASPEASRRRTSADRESAPLGM